MAEPEGVQILDSYTIEGTDVTIEPGNFVMIQPGPPMTPSYVGKVVKIEQKKGKEVFVEVLWYYRPEETKGGRRKFHGSREVFLSDEKETLSAKTINGKCKIHTFMEYCKLDHVGNEDFFCRFDYECATGTFVPDRVQVFCKCEMPNNPDKVMIQCEGCKDWFHPACVDMTMYDVDKTADFFCQSCSTGNRKKTEHIKIS